MYPSIKDDLRAHASRIADAGSRLIRTGDLREFTQMMASERRGADGYRYRAFISYSHSDEATARWLHRALERFVVPRELVGVEGERGPIPSRLSPLFRDEDELPGAAELGPQIEDALTDAAALIVICSPAAAASRWVGREITRFKEIDSSRPVFAVIAEGAPGGARECFPAALHLALRPDGTLAPDAASEPLAPDLQKQDKGMVRLKLAAGLLGVRYSDLYRRDLRRRRRVTAAVGSLGLVVVIALTALSIVAVSYAHVAVRERNLARQAQTLAEHDADMAERRAWLAQAAATEVRRQSDLLATRHCGREVDVRHSATRPRTRARTQSPVPHQPGPPSRSSEPRPL